MKELMRKKEWNKISSQIKFRNFIRFVIKKSRKEPEFLGRKFKIFAVVDKLQEARMKRMEYVKRLMARQMVEQNNLKFEVVEKLNNLANLTLYKSRYGEIC